MKAYPHGYFGSKRPTDFYIDVCRGPLSELTTLKKEAYRSEAGLEPTTPRPYRRALYQVELLNLH